MYIKAKIGNLVKLALPRLTAESSARCRSSRQLSHEVQACYVTGCEKSKGGMAETAQAQRARSLNVHAVAFVPQVSTSLRLAGHAVAALNLATLLSYDIGVLFISVVLCPAAPFRLQLQRPASYCNTYGDLTPAFMCRANQVLN